MSKDLFGGSPAQTSTTYPPPIFPPGYDFAKSFWGMIAPSLLGGTYPTYPNNVDPGLSPSMQTAIRMAQGYANSPAPYAMGQAGGTLGAFMNPQMAGAGWGTGQDRPSFMNFPQMPPSYPQGAGAMNPWRNIQQGYGGGGGDTGFGNPYAQMGGNGPPNQNVWRNGTGGPYQGQTGGYRIPYQGWFPQQGPGVGFSDNPFMGPPGGADQSASGSATYPGWQHPRPGLFGGQNPFMGPPGPPGQMTPGGDGFIPPTGGIENGLVPPTGGGQDQLPPTGGGQDQFPPTGGGQGQVGGQGQLIGPATRPDSMIMRNPRVGTSIMGRSPAIGGRPGGPLPGNQFGGGPGGATGPLPGDQFGGGPGSAGPLPGNQFGGGPGSAAGPLPGNQFIGPPGPADPTGGGFMNPLPGNQLIGPPGTADQKPPYATKPPVPGGSLLNILQQMRR
ncbi:MAG: hypothetical protein ACYSWU_11430 [Planctomycetota bacterium]|jgi:hypothetical protein